MVELYLLVAVLFAVMIVIGIGEAYYERDWPRNTIRWVAALVGVLLFAWLTFN